MQRIRANFAVGLNCPVSIELIVFLDTPTILQAVLEKDLLPYELPLSDFSDATALSYSHL